MRTWQLPGRGRRLKCQTRGFARTIWYKFSHYRAKPCRWCGQSYQHGAEMEIGKIEMFRFIQVDEQNLERT
jgi:hypothetical protein